jgi:hypothetical protein
MAITPEKKLLEAKKLLMFIRKHHGKLVTPAEFFEDSDLSASVRKDLVKKLVEKGFIDRHGAAQSTQYGMVEGNDIELLHLIEEPSALSAFLWPRYEGHLGSAPDDDDEELEDAVDDRSEESEEVDPQTALLRSIATNLAGLTELVAAVFTKLQEGGDVRTIDLAPFVKSYTGLHDRIASLEKKINTIQEGMGLTNGDEENPRGSDRGVQDEAEDDREGARSS